MSTLAERINNIEFGQVFRLDPDGRVTELPDEWAPNVYHDDDHDIDIDTDGWFAIVGLTGQDCYHGAVMHQSEYIGKGVADFMLSMTDEGPQTFVVVVVECLPTDDDPEPEPAGWAILYRGT